MSFGDEIHAFTVSMQAKTETAFANACALTLGSIQDGSAITGAPGQPVDTGTLKASWLLEFQDKDHATITTNIAYAPVIEDNTRTAYNPQGVKPKRPSLKDGGTRRIKSTVGGHHSVKLTVAAWPKLVTAATNGVTP